MVRKAANALKERFLGVAGSASGITSILGSWQVCHNLCLAAIAVLGVLGIAVAGMPLMFLQRLAFPLWIAAASFLVVTIFIYFKKRCISEKLILINSGIIVAGVPFKGLQSLLPVFWIFGGVLVAAGMFLFIRDKVQVYIDKI